MLIIQPALVAPLALVMRNSRVFGIPVYTLI